MSLSLFNIVLEPCIRYNHIEDNNSGSIKEIDLKNGSYTFKRIQNLK